MIDPTDQARDRLATSFGYQEVAPEDKPALVATCSRGSRGATT